MRRRGYRRNPYASDAFDKMSRMAEDPRTPQDELNDIGSWTHRRVADLADKILQNPSASARLLLRAMEESGDAMAALGNPALELLAMCGEDKPLHLVIRTANLQLESRGGGRHGIWERPAYDKILQELRTEDRILLKEPEYFSHEMLKKFFGAIDRSPWAMDVSQNATLYCLLSTKAIVQSQSNFINGKALRLCKSLSMFWIPSLDRFVK